MTEALSRYSFLDRMNRIDRIKDEMKRSVMKHLKRRLRVVSEAPQGNAVKGFL